MRIAIFQNEFANTRIYCKFQQGCYGQISPIARKNKMKPPTKLETGTIYKKIIKP